MNRKFPSANRDAGGLTAWLRNWHEGNPESANQAVSALLPDLHRMAAQMLASERPGHTLQPTALVNELYIRLQSGTAPDWAGRTHFFAVAARTLRRILIDHARAHRAQRRGGDRVKIDIEMIEVGEPCSCEAWLIVDEALTALEAVDERAARVTELKFFAGLQEQGIAAELGLSLITVKRDWKFARAWLACHLEPGRFPSPDSQDGEGG